MIVVTAEEFNPSDSPFWRISFSRDGGAVRTIKIRQEIQPTDDEIIAAVGAAFPVPSGRELKSTTLASRVERVAELAQAWQALKAAAADTTAFTALERSRLDTAAGLVAGRIKGLL